MKEQIVRLQHKLRDLSARRLQRWWKARRWRSCTLPQQLTRARLLISSCLLIQRKYKAWRKNSCQVVTSADRLGADITPAPSRQVSDHGTRSPSGNSCKNAVVSNDRLLCTPSPRARDDPLSPGEKRALALWKGCKLRRALACRGVQTKLHLRREHYLLICDVEARRHGSSRREQGSQHVAPWVDVLYTGLGKLQQEVLSELSDVLRGRAQLWGSPRLPLVWRGWPKDLMRLKGLALEVAGEEVSRDVSPLGTEPSLLASTTLQVYSTPSSPYLGVGEMDAVAAGSSRHSSRSPGSKPDKAAGSLAGTISGLDALDSLPSHHSRRSTSPSQTKDWSQVKPRVRCWETQPGGCSSRSAEGPVVAIAFSGGRGGGPLLKQTASSRGGSPTEQTLRLGPQKMPSRAGSPTEQTFRLGPQRVPSRGGSPTEQKFQLGPQRLQSERDQGPILRTRPGQPTSNTVGRPRPGHLGVDLVEAPGGSSPSGASAQQTLEEYWESAEVRAAWPAWTSGSAAGVTPCREASPTHVHESSSGRSSPHLVRSATPSPTPVPQREMRQQTEASKSAAQSSQPSPTSQLLREMRKQPEAAKSMRSNPPSPPSPQPPREIRKQTGQQGRLYEAWAAKAVLHETAPARQLH